MADRREGYALTVEHQCDEEATFGIASARSLSATAAPVALTDGEAAEFRKVRDAWLEWQDRLASASDEHADALRCGTCRGTGRKPG